MFKKFFLLIYREKSGKFVKISVSITERKIYQEISYSMINNCILFLKRGSTLEGLNLTVVFTTRSFLYVLGQVPELGRGSLSVTLTPPALFINATLDC